MIAKDMVPGETYVGTADGPTEMDGVAFTVLATVSFCPEATFTFMAINAWERDEYSLVQVQLDRWGYPFPEAIVFAPGDWVLPLDKGGEAYMRHDFRAARHAEG
jgi:hypothetical protein